MHVLAPAAAWLVSRALVLWLLLGTHAWVTGDLTYFDHSLHLATREGLGATLVEYPVPGLVVVAVPWVVARALELLGQPDRYAEVVVALALLTDAVFAVLLHRWGSRTTQAALWTWVLAVPLLGATVYARFDLLPGVLAAVALIAAAARPRMSAAAAATAAGLKLWPAVLLPALAAPRPTRRAVVLVAGLTGVTLALLSVVAAGWQRLVSPLTWQAERGLQVESVPATPAMLAWSVGVGGHRVEFSEHNAFEVYDGWAPGLLVAGTALTVAVVVALTVVWGAAWRQGDVLGTEAVAWLSLAAVAGLVVSSKVLSPQYLLWLLPLAAAALAVARPGRDRRLLRWWAGTLLVATGLTQLVFPVLYGWVIERGPWSPWVVLLLAVRNALLVGLFAVALAEAWRHVRRPAQRGRALDRQPPGPDGKDTRSLR